TELMGTCTQFLADDTSGVNGVDNDGATGFRSVYNGMIVEQYAHMVDMPIGIIEEGEVTTPGFLQEAYRLTLLSLLPCISAQPYTYHLEHHLRQAGAVYAH